MNLTDKQKEQMYAAIKADARYGILNHEYDDGFEAGYAAAVNRECAWTWNVYDFSTACGKVVERDSTFCPNCGGKVVGVKNG